MQTVSWRCEDGPLIVDRGPADCQEDAPLAFGRRHADADFSAMRNPTTMNHACLPFVDHFIMISHLSSLFFTRLWDSDDWFVCLEHSVRGPHWVGFPEAKKTNEKDKTSDITITHRRKKERTVERITGRSYLQ
ncbi:hypothetical protein BHE74_00028412 [Ensete ventricosum]|nr:hypothetical protein BHE74_00028412 [Ensete ventricosum]